jgi:CRP/FNR family transcriptional regulator, cyclic AMP receptor protein
VVSDQGKEAIIATFGPGDFFGEGGLTGQTVRLASAVAMTAADLVKIEKDAMVRLLTDRPTFSAKFTEFLVARNIQVEADIVDQLFNSSEKRLARLLLLLDNFNNDGELRPIVPKISQEVLASRVGTTRSRINSFMNKFRKLGLIEYCFVAVLAHFIGAGTFDECDLIFTDVASVRSPDRLRLAKGRRRPPPRSNATMAIALQSGLSR